MQGEIRKYIEEGVAARSAIRENGIEGAAAVIVNALKSGHKLITFGNGGSAADVQHIEIRLYTM
ncbi:MAG: SIS domain-containing protein [Candidatus Micrarchaeaceae archaeon]